MTIAVSLGTWLYGIRYRRVEWICCIPGTWILRERRKRKACEKKASEKSINYIPSHYLIHNSHQNTYTHSSFSKPSIRESERMEMYSTSTSRFLQVTFSPLEALMHEPAFAGLTSDVNAADMRYWRFPRAGSLQVKLKLEMQPAGISNTLNLFRAFSVWRSNISLACDVSWIFTRNLL